MLTSYTLLIGGVLGLCYLIFTIFIRQMVSGYRHIPCAKQSFLLSRLLHEPTTFEISEWMTTTPNDGIIRYFGFLNQERLLLTDPGTIKKILLKDSYKYDKLPSLAALQYPAGVSGLVSAKGNLHKIHRRHTIAAFNNSIIKRLYPTIWHSVGLTVQSLSNRTSEQPKNIVKMNSFARAACLDTVGSAAFSLDLGTLHSPEQSLVKDYLRPFQKGERSPLFLKLLQICPVALQVPAVAVVKTFLRIDISDMACLLRETLDKKLEVAKHQKIDRSLSPSIEEGTPSDILDGLVARAYSHISERSLLKHAMTTMAGSLEMVSNQLSWAIFALSLPEHQQIQEKLRREIRTRFPYQPTTVTWEHINSLPFLTGVVNEILRLYPSVSHRSRVCNTPAELQGLCIKKGTILTWPVYGMNRSPAQWGEDAHVFRPERWHEQNQNGVVERKRDVYAFMTFGQGPRKCPGEHYTRAVLACMLLGLVGRFQFTMPKEMGNVLEDDGGCKVGFGIVMKADIRAVVEEVPGWGGESSGNLV